MRILLCMLIAVGGVSAQSSTNTATTATTKATVKTPAKTPNKTSVKTAKNLPAQNGIPKDAVETEPGFFRWTDKEGKNWIYRRTPFGVTRIPADAINIHQAAVDKEEAMAERTTAVAQGDSVRFAETTPFGKRTWVRKKTDLNETEQRIWDQQQKTSTASRTAEKE